MSVEWNTTRLRAALACAGRHPHRGHLPSSRNAAVRRRDTRLGVLAREACETFCLSPGPRRANGWYQVVISGRRISLLDLLNPRDVASRSRSIESAAPPCLSRVSLPFSPFRLEAIVVHEAYFGLLPPPLGEWSPFRKLLLENPSVGEAFAGRTLRNENEPARDLTEPRATQVYARASVSLGSTDIALVASSTLDRLGVPLLPDPAALPRRDRLRVHSRLPFLGPEALDAGPFVLRGSSLRPHAALAFATPHATAALGDGAPACVSGCSASATRVLD